MNHNNFHFTQIPGKTNDVIFLKSPTTIFLGHFRSFLPDVNFFQKIQLSHETIYRPPTSCYVSGKTDEPIPRKRTDRRKDGWTDPFL